MSSTHTLTVNIPAMLGIAAACISLAAGCTTNPTAPQSTYSSITEPADVAGSIETASSPPVMQQLELEPENETGATQEPERKEVPEWPGMALDLDAGHVDLEATVIGHGCEWLELVACTVGGREHESLVSVAGRPSHLHLALLLLGIEPGQPQRGVRGEDGWVILPPTGGRVEVSFVLPAEADAPQRVVPVASWVLDRRIDAALPETPGGGWLFTGSRMMRDERDPDAPAVYLADANGSVVSLVHFGDETIGRDTNLSQATDGQNLAPFTDRMPPNGTRVWLRIARPSNP